MTVPPRFALSDEERRLRANATAIAERWRPQDRRALTRDQLLSLFQTLAPLGYLRSTLTPPDDANGPAVLSFAAVVEGLSPALPLLGNHSVQRYLAADGNADQRSRYLQPLLAGRSIAGIAISEPDVGGDLRAITTRARRTDLGYVLDGRKHWVTHGTTADLFVVLAMFDAGPTRFLVPGDTPGLTRTPMQPSGLSHLSFATLTFEACEIGRAQLFGREGAGLDGAKAAFPIARLLAGLQAIRLGEAAVNRALAFAAARQVFGRRVIEAESVTSAAATLRSRLESARLLCYRGLTELDDRAGVNALAAGAKAIATDAAVAAAAWAKALLGAAALEAQDPIVQLADDCDMMAVVDGTAVLNRLVAGRAIRKAAPA